MAHSSTSFAQSAELRASRETSSPMTMPALPSATSLTSRWKPSRPATWAPERPRSQSMTWIRSIGQPAAMARSRRAYWRWVLAVLDHLAQRRLPDVEIGIARQMLGRDLLGHARPPWAATGSRRRSRRRCRPAAGAGAELRLAADRGCPGRPGDLDPGRQALAHQNGTAAWGVAAPRGGMGSARASAAGGLDPVPGQPAGVDGLGRASARSRLRRCTVTPKRSWIARRQAGVVSVGSAALRARMNATMAADSL